MIKNLSKTSFLRFSSFLTNFTPLIDLSMQVAQNFVVYIQVKEYNFLAMFQKGGNIVNMKKSKLAIGLLTAVMCCGALASCDNYPVKYSKDGVILRYKDKASDEWVSIKADELLVDYYDDSSKYQSIFDAIYSIVVRNYFNSKDPADYNGVDSPFKQMDQIKIDAQADVDAAKRTAQKNADNNNTKYKDEWDTILQSKGVENEDELYNSFILERQKTTFEKNFKDEHIETIKTGDSSVVVKPALTGSDPSKDIKVLNGYFDDMLPYHISHILVKLDDSANTNYSNGTISEDNIENIYNLVDELKGGESSFESLAKRFSTDPGSSSKWGDLGIVDYSTGFIDEFLLGLYTYENLLAPQAIQTKVHASKVNLPGNTAAEYTALSNEANFDLEYNSTDDSYKAADTLAIPSIELSTIKELYDVKDVTKVDKKAVLDDNANFYPRNIIYNKYINKHTVSLITDDSAIEATDSMLTGFKSMEINGVTKKVLSVKTNGEWSPILVARGESGGTNGLFFIVVNRSPFVETQNGSTLTEYYTTYNPNDPSYPKDAQGNKKVTYINYANPNISNDSKDRERAESLKTSIQSYNSDRITKYLYTKYSKDIEICDAKLREALNKWIYRSLEKNNMDEEENWENKWSSYLDTLRKQNQERSKLVSEVCKINFNNANKDEEEINVAEAAAILHKEGVSNAKIDELLYKYVKVADAAGSYNLVNGEYVAVTNGNYNKVAKTMKDLFKTDGGLCNDGKNHI